MTRGEKQSGDRGGQSRQRARASLTYEHVHKWFADLAFIKAADGFSPSIKLELGE